MKVKLGPYKVDREFWAALQSLPGANDEQRVLKALSMAIAVVERHNKARLEAIGNETAPPLVEIASQVVTDAAELAFITGADAAVPIWNGECGPAIRGKFDDDGSFREATPEEIAAEDAAPKRTATITHVDHERGIVTFGTDDGIPSGGHP